MPSPRDGNRNAAKRVADLSAGPWAEWPDMPLWERACRWIQTYCVLPKGYGAGECVELAPFQREWLAEVLADGVSAAAMQLPRGNGKSTFLACVALWALFDERDGQAPQIPIVATTVNQAVRSVYGVALAMRAAHPELEARSLTYSAIGNQRLTVPRNGGEMFPVSNDPDGLQGLDPSLAVCDEIGFMPIESWDSLLLASGKRPRSLVIGIGTPGFDKFSALWHMRTQVHAGVELPGFRFTEYAADEGCQVRDRAQWERANPALANGYMDVRALETAVALSPEAHFRIFRLGQWVDGVESWLGDDGRNVWRACDDPWEMVPGAPTYVGIDVALKHDTTAVAWIQEREPGRFHVKAHVWAPRDDGRLDAADVQRFVRELADTYEVVAIGYDPRFFDLPAQQLADEGYPILEFPQSLERMTPAVTGTYEAIKRRELTHDGDPQLEAHVLNAVARFNERGFTLAKSKSRDKIDAAVAMVIAHALAAKPVPLVDVAASVW